MQANPTSSHEVSSNGHAAPGVSVSGPALAGPPAGREPARDHRILRLARRLVAAQAAFAVQRGELVAADGVEVLPPAAVRWISQWGAGGPRAVDDLLAPPEEIATGLEAALRAEWAAAGLRSFLSVPVLSSSPGATVLLVAAVAHPRPWSEEDREALADLAALAAADLSGPGRETCERWSGPESTLHDRRLRTLIEHSSDIITILNVEGTALYESPSVERILGYRPDELIGTNVLECIHPDDLPVITAVLAEISAQPGHMPALSPPYRFRHKDGTWRWMESTGTDLRNDPQIGGLVINTRDVTERQEAEEALRRSEARFRTVFEEAGIGMALVDSEGRPLHVNPALERMLGYPAAELRTLPFPEFTHPADRNLDWELFQELRQGARPSYSIDKRYVRKDGRIIWGRLTASGVRNVAGEIELVVGMVQDITDQKRAAQRSDAFRKLGQVLNTAATPEDAGRIVLETAERILGWDACWLDLFSPDGKTNSTLLLVDRIDGQKQDVPRSSGQSAPSPMAQRALDEGPLLLLCEPGQLPAPDAEDFLPFGDVERSSASILCVPIRSGARTVGVVSIQSYTFLAYDDEDLAIFQALADYCAGALERTQAEAARRELEQQLIQAQKMEAVGRLAGGVAHDFNNVLAVINGYSDLLLMRMSPADPARASIEQIRQAGERAARLTQQLLVFSRKQIVQTRVLQLEEVIHGVDRMLRRIIGEDVELVTLVPSPVAPVVADLSQIEQILFNLAVNARDAMPRGGKLVIEVTDVRIEPDQAERIPGARTGPHVRLTVTDTGCGMTAETLEHIFEPFFTTKEPGKGTGLGLATVYGIVAQSGGFLQVESTPSHGSTFRVYFPSAPHPRCEEPADDPLTPVPSAEHETILLAEDEPMMRSLARHILEASGYRVLEAAHGEEAARLAEQYPGPIHLLLTDVVMPQMGGRELAERFRQLHPEARVLFMSGYTDDAVIRHGINQATTAFLQKPFTPAVLTQEVRKVLTS